MLLFGVGSILSPFAFLALLMLPTPYLVNVLLFPLLAIPFWLIDVFTVRMVVAGEKRGIFGYKV